jgi:hypothetical protein
VRYSVSQVAATSFPSVDDNDDTSSDRRRDMTGAALRWWGEDGTTRALAHAHRHTDRGRCESWRVHEHTREAMKGTQRCNEHPRFASCPRVLNLPRGPRGRRELRERKAASGSQNPLSSTVVRASCCLLARSRFNRCHCESRGEHPPTSTRATHRAQRTTCARTELRKQQTSTTTCSLQ